MTPAHYSDGEFLESRPVTFQFTSEGRLVVEGEGVTLDVPIDAVRTSDRLGSIPRFIYLPAGAVLETSDHDTCERALAGRTSTRLSRWLARLENHSGIAAVATVLVVAFAAAGFHFGLPQLARRVAERTPASIEAQAGRAALAALNSHFPPSQLGASDRQRVHAQLRRLLPEPSTQELPRLEFRMMPDGAANAFALPGEILLVTDGLVRLATDDEIAAVLAHELGHLRYRHGLQSVIRRSFALLFVTTVTGDLSTLTSFASTLPFVILQNGYSRDFEREADAFAHELLLARDIDPRHFSNVLVKIDPSRNASGLTPGYFSTHPTTAERTARFGAPGETALQLSPPTSMIKPDQLPVATTQIKPVYPARLRREGVTGEVLVKFIVDTEGNVREAEVARSSHVEFEPAALAAITRWKFEPGRNEGRPVNTRMQVPIVFSIMDDGGHDPATGAVP